MDASSQEIFKGELSCRIVIEFFGQLRQGLIDPQAKFGGRCKWVALHVIDEECEFAQREGAADLVIGVVTAPIDPVQGLA